MTIAFVARIHGNRNVTQHRFRPRRRNDDRLTAFDVGITNLPDAAVFLFGLDFEIRHCGLQFWIPIDEALAAVDQPLFVQAHEGFDDDLRQIVVHREILAAPIDRCAEPAHLLQDGGSRDVLPLPHFLDELLASDRAPLEALGGKLAFDDDLRRNASVVGAGQPQRVEPQHAVIPRQRVHDGLVERVTHVQDAGAIRRRQLDRERWLGWIGARAEVAARFPYGRPARLDCGRVKAFRQLARGRGDQISGRHFKVER